MQTIKKLISKCVIVLIIITGFQCAAAVVAPVFVALIGAKTWTNTADEKNTFFFFDLQDGSNTSSFHGNENLSIGGQASFTGKLDNHNIQFTYDAGTDTSRAGKTYKGTVNDASTVMTLKGSDATDPLPAVTLNAQ